MGFSFRITNDNREAIKKQIRESGGAALEDAANELLRTANETVPYREGVLKGSGEVQPVNKAAMTIDVTYGGEASAYAVKQHEDTTLQHTGKGRSKWLELAAKENAGRLGVKIGTGIQERLG